MRARILSIILPAILVVGASVAAAAPAHAATGDSAKVFSQTNAHRVKVGLKPLISDPALDKAAQAWAQQLATSCTFVHSTATWRAARVSSAGWSATGENIAAGYSAASVVSGWMASAGHRANILNSKYTGVGIGYAKGTCYGSYWVQIFGWTKTAAVPGAGDGNGDFNTDVVAVDSKGQLLMHRGNGKGGWIGSPTVASTGWLPTDKLVPLGDFTGDGISDVGRFRTSGAIELLKGTGAGTYAAPVALGTLWTGYRHVMGGIDFNGDRRPDIMAVTPGGAIFLHPGNGAGRLGAPKQVGAGWSKVTAAFYAGDFNGDTRGDIITRGADGRLWLNPSNGVGGWGKPAPISAGWNSMTAIFSPGDFDGSGKPDVLARRADGAVSLWRGNGRGGWSSSSTVATGWNVLSTFG
jgi:hypothetical protein